MGRTWTAPLQWGNVGINPPNALRQNGYKALDYPAASTFNYAFNRTQTCIEELQDAVDAGTGVYQATATRSGTVWAITTTDTPPTDKPYILQFVASLGFVEGNTIKINGTAYSLYQPNLKALKNGAWVSGTAVTLDVNPSNKRAFYGGTGGGSISIVSVTVPTASWTLADRPSGYVTNKYEQTISVSGLSATAMLAIDPKTDETMWMLVDKSISLVAVNNGNGTVTMKAFGVKPETDLTVDLIVMEVG